MYPESISKSIHGNDKNRLDAHAEVYFLNSNSDLDKKDRLRVQLQFYTKLLKVDWIKRNDPTHVLLTFENASTL